MSDKENLFLHQFIECAEVKDQRHHLKLYPKVFVGSAVVEALIQKGYVANAEDAVAKANELMDGGLFAHVTQEHKFENAELFYRFYSDEEHKICSRSNFPVWTKPVLISLITPLLRKKINGVVGIADNKHDCSDAEAADFEDVKHGDKDSKEWAIFAANRPWVMKDFVSQVPNVGESKDGPVLDLKEGGQPSTLFAEVKRIGEASNSSAVAVIFGSVTCPVWRLFGCQDLHKAFRKKNLPVLHVYTLEAHPIDFAAPPNQDGPMALRRQIRVHENEAERRMAALEGQAIISRQVGEVVNMVLDGMDDALENAYEARSIRAFVLDTATGNVVYKSGKGPYSIPAKINDIAALQL